MKRPISSHHCIDLDAPPSAATRCSQTGGSFGGSGADTVARSTITAPLRAGRAQPSTGAGGSDVRWAEILRCHNSVSSFNIPYGKYTCSGGGN